jgi:hypothetical protein
VRSCHRRLVEHGVEDGQPEGLRLATRVNGLTSTTTPISIRIVTGLAPHVLRQAVYHEVQHAMDILAGHRLAVDELEARAVEAARFCFAMEGRL